MVLKAVLRVVSLLFGGVLLVSEMLGLGSMQLSGWVLIAVSALLGLETLRSAFQMYRANAAKWRAEKTLAISVGETESSDD